MTRNEEFLNWVADRLVYVYHESDNVDFVHRLRQLAKEEGARSRLHSYSATAEKQKERRERIAAVVLAGLASSWSYVSGAHKNAPLAVEWADALIAELDRKEEE